MPSKKSTYDYQTTEGGRNVYKYMTLESLPDNLERDIIKMLKGGWIDRISGHVSLARIYKAKPDVHYSVIQKIYNKHKSEIGDYHGMTSADPNLCHLRSIL